MTTEGFEAHKEFIGYSDNFEQEVTSKKGCRNSHGEVKYDLRFHFAGRSEECGCAWT